MSRWMLVICLILITTVARAADRPAVLANVFDNPALRGEVTFRWFGLPLYTARLFTPGGQAPDWRNPLGLQLIYARSISRDSSCRSKASSRSCGERSCHAGEARMRP